MRAGAVSPREPSSTGGSLADTALSPASSASLRSDEAARREGRVLAAPAGFASATPIELLALVATGWSHATPSSAETVAPATPTVAVETNMELARSLYKEGRERYDADDFEGALAQFQDAFATAPVWRIRYNIAQLQRELGHADDARQELEAYLAEGGAEVGEGRRREVERMLGELGEDTGSAAN